MWFVTNPKTNETSDFSRVTDGAQFIGQKIARSKYSLVEQSQFHLDQALTAFNELEEYGFEKTTPRPMELKVILDAQLQFANIYSQLAVATASG